jgi:hypothetical protein
MRILGVKNWKKVALNRDEWAELLKKARTHQGLSSQWWWYSGQGVKLTVHLLLVTKFRMTEDLPPLHGVNRERFTRCLIYNWPASYWPNYKKHLATENFLSGQPHSSDSQISEEHFYTWFVDLRDWQIQCFTGVFVIFLCIHIWDIKIGMPDKWQVDTATTASKLWSRNVVHSVIPMIAGLLT